MCSSVLLTHINFVDMTGTLLGMVHTAWSKSKSYPLRPDVNTMLRRRQMIKEHARK